MITIVKETLEEQIKEGMKAEAMAKYWGMPLNTFRKALKSFNREREEAGEAKLRIRNFRLEEPFKLVSKSDKTNNTDNFFNE